MNKIEEMVERYIAEAKHRELSVIVEEENLDEAATTTFINKAFSDGEIETSGTNIISLMNYKPSRFALDGQYSELKNCVIARLKAFFGEIQRLRLICICGSYELENIYA